MADQPKATPSNIADFCQRWHISISTFYKWQAEGHGPRTLRIGPKRRIITPEDEAAWRAAREAEAK
jgi:hypothetical protein